MKCHVLVADVVFVWLLIVFVAATTATPVALWLGVASSDFTAHDGCMLLPADLIF